MGSSASTITGLRDQRAGDGHALALATGQLARPLPDLLGQSDLLDQRVHAAAPLGAGEAALQEERKLDVLDDVQHVDQVERLEDEPDHARAEVRERVVLDA